ncbi:MAG TPA: hypothetical protein H9851_02780, partial [Candidatus Borkfalkia faecavium]|nr:hypothetical protein [Candidatus Borkfalkia faecavium]
WQTAHYVCRIARSACRSSSQKVLRYFLGALYMRSPFPLKKGEGMRKGRMFFIDTQTRKISPLGQSRLLLPSVEMTRMVLF